MAGFAICTSKSLLSIQYSIFLLCSSYNFLWCYSATWLQTLLLLLMSLVTDLSSRYFSLLNQRWSPPLTLQPSHCSTFRIMCDVPSIAVFCSESIECFPGTASIFFRKLLVTIPVAPIITGTIVHFRFHIRCISIHKLYYYYYLCRILLHCRHLRLYIYGMKWVPLNVGSILTFFRRHRGEPQPPIKLMFRLRFEPGSNQI